MGMDGWVVGDVAVAMNMDGDTGRSVSIGQLRWHRGRHCLQKSAAILDMEC